MDRYSYAIVWTPLPIITWFIPLIGHTGITDSSGNIHDFGGSHYISVDNFTFGRPTKYYKLDVAKARSDWNNAISAADGKFCRRNHNLITSNCHCHVADALNEMEYNGKRNYNQLDVFFMTLKANYVGFTGFIRQWGVFLLLLAAVLLVVTFCL